MMLHECPPNGVCALLVAFQSGSDMTSLQNICDGDQTESRIVVTNSACIGLANIGYLAGQD